MTFSLLGYNMRTRAFGAIVASSAVGTGGAVTFGAAERGIVLSQGYTDPRLGPAGLTALELPQGNAVSAVGAMRIAAGKEVEWRQLAAVDFDGGVASFTGSRCDSPCGEAFGPGCVAVGASVASQRVLLDMVAMFASGAEDLIGDALLDALIAGIKVGGSRYPLQSAALHLFQIGLDFPYADLRVDFSPNPVTDLRVLWSLWSSVVDGYATRALVPADAPQEGLLEGHRLPLSPDPEAR